MFFKAAPSYAMICSFRGRGTGRGHKKKVRLFSHNWMRNWAILLCVRDKAVVDQPASQSASLIRLIDPQRGVKN